MILPSFSLLEPVTKKNALSMLGDSGKELKIIAGGTELVGSMKIGLLAPRYVMSLGAIKGLRGITSRRNEIIIRSATTLADIITSPLINKHFASIVQAARVIAAPPIQNRATIGGNILQDTRCLCFNQSDLFRRGLKPCFKAGGSVCHAVKGGKRCLSVYQGDLAPALIAFDSKVKLEKKGSYRTIPLLGLFTGKGENPFSLHPDELLTEIIIPVPQGRYGSSYEKMRIRKGLEYPLASSSVLVSEDKNGKMSDLRVVVGAAGPTPKLLGTIAPYLDGGTLSMQALDKIADLAAKSMEAVNNLALPAAYRVEVSKVLTKRAFQNALQNMRKA